MVRQGSPAGTGEGRNTAADENDARRFHNQDPHSPESIAQSVESLEAAIRSLESRVMNLGAELHYQIQGVEHRGEEATRRLALDVLAMGEALSRRIRAQPAAAPVVAPRPARRFSPLVAGLSGALAASLAALAWIALHHADLLRAGPQAAPTVAALYEPSADPPTPPAPDPAAQPADPKPAAVAPRRHPHPRSMVHHLARATSESAPPPAPLPDTLPGSGGHSILGPSPG